MSRYKKTGSVMSKTDWSKLQQAARYEQIDNRRAISQRIDAWNKGPVQGPIRPSSSSPTVWRSPVEAVARESIGRGPVLDQVGERILNRRQMDKLRKAQRAIDRAYGVGAAAARGVSSASPYARAILPVMRAVKWAMDNSDYLPNYISTPGSEEWVTPAGWTLTQDCGLPTPFTAQASLYGNIIPNWGFCSTNQYWDWQPIGSVVGPYHRTLAMGYGQGEGITKTMDFNRVYVRDYWDPNPAEVPHPVSTPGTTYRTDNMMLNPNVVRTLPGELNVEAIVHAPVVDPVLTAFPSVVNAIAQGTTAETLVSTVRIPAGPPFNGGTIVGSPGARNPPAKGGAYS